LGSNNIKNNYAGLQLLLLKQSSNDRMNQINDFTIFEIRSNTFKNSYYPQTRSGVS